MATLWLQLWHEKSRFSCFAVSWLYLSAEHVRSESFDWGMDFTLSSTLLKCSYAELQPFPAKVSTC